MYSSFQANGCLRAVRIKLHTERNYILLIVMGYFERNGNFTELRELPRKFSKYAGKVFQILREADA
jgi:hypothetical protein